MRPQNDSITALSYGHPLAPIEGARPASRTFWLNAQDVKLNAAVGVDHEAPGRISPACGHPEGVCHQHRGLGRVDRPSDQPAREHVEDDTAVDLALARVLLGDVGHPQLVGRFAAELAPHQVRAADPADTGAA